MCAAVVRGIARNESSSIGNFWSDLVRITLYVLLPLSIIGALIMLWQGMVQNFDAGVTATTLEGGKQFIATGPSLRRLRSSCSGPTAAASST